MDRSDRITVATIVALFPRRTFSDGINGRAFFCRHSGASVNINLHPSHQALSPTPARAMPSSTTRVSAPPSNTPFDYFCFESTDTSSVILNYVALKGLLQTQTIEQVVQQVAQYVQMHMTKRHTQTFTFHLFCNGMVIREMAQHRVFMLHFARLFKETFPQELNACYVYNAPSFFSSIYELLRPVLPKSSRDKIILAKSSPTQRTHTLTSPPQIDTTGGCATSGASTQTTTSSSTKSVLSPAAPSVCL